MSSTLPQPMYCSNGERRNIPAKNAVRRSSGESGSALVEFVVCFGLFWAPLFFGTLVMGFSLIQALQVTQVCRDAGHMYAFGTDFSQSSNKYLVASFAPWLNIDPTGAGGNSVLILSTVTYVDDTLCPNGKQPSGASCGNYQKTVFLKWVVVGNSSIHQSAFQSASGPPSTDSYGNVSNYLTDPAAQASGISPNVISITSSQTLAYVAEMYDHSATSWNTFLAQPWISSRAIF